jgi:hypothetical protein
MMGGRLMLSSLFDEYSLNARVRPALLALLPPVAFLYLVFPQLYGVLAGAAGVFVVFGLVTVLAHFCRSAGKTAEQKLFTAWGGIPTTIMLRHRDVYFDPITKGRYHRFVAKNIEGWAAPSAEEELHDPHEADKKYDSAVRWLLEYTRDQKQYPLLFKENISYGFRRNCYGIKWLAASLALLPIAVFIPNFVIDGSSYIDGSTPNAWVLICLSALMFFWWIFVVKDAWVKDAAIGYAVRLFAACEADGRT